MSLAPGTRLGPYEILALAGAGGMGEVYKARDTRLDRTVAIKILSPSLAADAQFRERFDREARAISRIEHPHIFKRRPRPTGVLEVCNIGCVRHFIEALGHILAYGANGSGNDEKQKNDRANAPLIGRGRTFLIMRGRIEIGSREHCASLHSTY